MKIIKQQMDIIYIMNLNVPYNSKLAIDIANIFNCDEWYILFFKNHGYCTKLNKKNRSKICS